MKLAILFASLLAMALNGCSWIPRAGPSTGEVLEQARAGGEIMFDVVEVDERVVSTLLSQPKESLAARFKKTAEPPEVKIAIGDTISVLIWESAAGGLFSAGAACALGGRFENGYRASRPRVAASRGRDRRSGRARPPARRGGAPAHQ